MRYNKSKVLFVQMLVLLLASYVLPLQAYMSQEPIAGSNNFHQYSAMYLAPLDMDATTAPFVFRQFGAVLVHLVYKAGLFVDLDIRLHASEEMRRVFFAAILVNWIGLFLAVGFVVDIVNRATSFQKPLVGMAAGFFMLTSYGTPTYAVSGLMDAWTWFFVAAIYHSILARREALVWGLLVLSVTQREITPLIFAVWSFVDLVTSRDDFAMRRQALVRGVLCLGLFAGYLGLRLLVFPEVKGFSGQLSVSAWRENLAFSGVGVGFLFKLLVQQNTLILLSVLAAITVWRKGRAELPQLVRAGGGNLVVILLVLFALGVGSGIWLNTARLLLFMMPVVAVFCALMLENFWAGEGGDTGSGG